MRRVKIEKGNLFHHSVFSAQHFYFQHNKQQRVYDQHFISHQQLIII